MRADARQQACLVTISLRRGDVVLLDERRGRVAQDQPDALGLGLSGAQAGLRAGMLP